MTRMPVLFVGHGNPMNAIKDNEFSLTWKQIGQSLPRPKAIVCVSAHWETSGTAITAMDSPRTIYDFYGFPDTLYQAVYAAPGSKILSEMMQKQLPFARLDYDWGLDHGAWSVLSRLFPDASIPVVELSLDRNLTGEQHYELAAKLAPLREQGILVLCSGNLVHNLSLIAWQDTAFEWAAQFDQTVKKFILEHDHAALIHFELLQNAHAAIPTPEHFLPLLYLLALQRDDDTVQYFCEKVTMGSLSMRGVRLG